MSFTTPQAGLVQTAAGRDAHGQLMTDPHGPSQTASHPSVTPPALQVVADGHYWMGVWTGRHPSARSPLGQHHPQIRSLPQPTHSSRRCSCR